MNRRLAVIAYSQFYTDIRVIREAKAAVEAGFDVEVFSLKEKPGASYEGIDVCMQNRVQYKGNNKAKFLWNYIRFFIFSFWKVTSNHLKQKYDVIHVHNMPNFLVFSCLIPKLTGAHIILDIHDVMPELFAEKFGRSLSDIWIRTLYLEEKLAGNFADTVISTNRLITERLKKNGISKETFPEILNAADEEMFPPFADHDFSQRPVRMIFPSTIAQRLGLDILIDAVSILKDMKSPVQLRIFGMGEYAEEVKRRIAEEGLQDYIEFPGLISFDELNAELQQAQIGLLPWPSNFSTNYQMPIKVHEYFIKGLCVIAADVRIVKEYFPNEVITFHAGDAEDLAKTIIRTVENPEQMRSHALKGHAFAKLHSWSDYKRQYINLLNGF